MSLHQDISMQFNPIKFEIGGKDVKKSILVSITPKDVPPLISPAGDVIPSSWIFYAKRSCHGNKIQKRSHLVNS